MLPSLIVIARNPVSILSDFLQMKTYSTIAVLVDENTQANCYPLIEKSLPPHQVIVVPSGETHKNLVTCSSIWHQLTDCSLDRHSLVIVLGGGVLGDMGGFCSATYKRGIDFIIMPTTLLAQVDASVGGKLGVDFQNLKNHIGLFQEPVATLIATDFLTTLPERELRSGYAEVIKHCLISDLKMWNTIRNNSLQDQNWETLVRHSVEFKRSVVQEDPREKGLRKILNFGHTIGHAVESHFLEANNRIFHGEAIAIGMICEGYLAVVKKKLEKRDLDQIDHYITSIFGRVAMPPERKPILKIMAQDKKNKGKKILMALPEGIGKAVWDVEISEEEVLESLSYYASL